MTSRLDLQHRGQIDAMIAKTFSSSRLARIIIERGDRESLAAQRRNLDRRCRNVSRPTFGASICAHRSNSSAPVIFEALMGVNDNPYPIPTLQCSLYEQANLNSKPVRAGTPEPTSLTMPLPTIGPSRDILCCVRNVRGRHQQLTPSSANIPSLHRETARSNVSSSSQPVPNAVRK